jgi:uncharacterized RDD family membrane protein YckC
MKCPKCEYLGFETGDRCKNCGYDFSTLMAAEDAVPDFDLQTHDEASAVPDAWLKELDQDFGVPQRFSDTIDTIHRIEPFAPLELTTDSPLAPIAVSPIAPINESPFAPTSEAPSHRPASAPIAPTRVSPFAPASETPIALPLFPPVQAVDDEPLIRMPAAPRAPLAVRRTPDAQRLRAFARPAQRDIEPAFEFAEDTTEPGAAASSSAPSVASALAGVVTSGPWARLAAAAIDHAILLAIDASVVYFTLKIAALTLADWRLVPLAPLAAFLLLFKFTYFSAFTAVGGQTIGKMGSGIRVIAADGTVVDASRAVRRTLAGAVSLLTLGVGFAPAIFGADHRALHDRVAGTRVVAV